MLDDIKMSSNQPKLVKSVPNIPQTTARTVSTEGRIESSQGQVIKLPERKKRKPIPTWVVILVTIIIILLIIIYAAYLSSKALQAQSTLVVQAFPNLHPFGVDPGLIFKLVARVVISLTMEVSTSQSLNDSTTGYTYSTTATTT